MRQTYQILEHTADIAVRVRGRDPKQLFRNGAAAMFDIIARRKKGGMCPVEKRRIRLTAGSKEELFVFWLNELLSLSAAYGLIFTRFDIKRLSDTCIEAWCTAAGREHFASRTEIKAATYHDMRIERQRGFWQTTVIFDV